MTAETKANTVSDESKSDGEEVTDAPRYPRPKVLLVDLEEADAEAVRDAGFNVAEGTFGRPLRVGVAEEPVFVRPRHNLPGATEQEVVVVDLEVPKADDGDPGLPTPGKTGVWQRPVTGTIDPGPIVAHFMRDPMDRILQHGGVFIAFMAAAGQTDYTYAEFSYGVLSHGQETRMSRRDFLTVLQELNVVSDAGEEISMALEVIPELAQSIEQSHFSVTIDRPYMVPEGEWIVLARSKFGKTVAAAVSPSDERKGWVFILPRVPNKGELVRSLLEGLLPRLAPKLFPHSEAAHWVDDQEYQLPRVADLQRQIRKVEVEAESRIAEIGNEISEERRTFGFLSRMLTETGDGLVEAVIEALEFLGFSDVRDADEEPCEDETIGESTESRRREDIQIHDQSPLLLVEVKGITHLPREHASLQVTKYLAPRMKHFGRTDLAGLAIINHQRGLPPLSRERENVFQKDILTNAEAQGFGLLTTFDLYRLCRSYLRNGWNPPEVVDVFYRNGRIEPVPSSYRLLGTVDAFWEEASALSIDLVGCLKVGDNISYETGLEFIEEEVTSLMLDDISVDRAESEDQVGVKTGLPKEKARRGTRVFVVSR